MQKFVIGDKVMWLKNPEDIGTVTHTESGIVEVNWHDGCGSFNYPTTDTRLSRVYTTPAGVEEQQAVALLLSLGYTLSKQPMVTNISNKA